ncbi:MAG: hypothetical protein ACRCVX_10720, partial [Shewanella sp.]
MNLYLDIETIPTQRPDIIAEIREELLADKDAKIAAIAPPGNYKKQETIDEWMAIEAPKIIAKIEGEFEASVDAAYRKTALDGAFGQICVAGVAFDEGYAWSIFDAALREPVTLSELNKFLEENIQPCHQLSTVIIGHNVLNFDLRFLMQRFMVNGIKPHRTLAWAASAKPWESEKVFDTMINWAGVGNRISLDKLCKALSITSPKTEISGSNVWDYVKSNRLAEVA